MVATVFVIDDDPDLHQSVSRLAGSDDVLVETYDSGLAFLREFNPERPGCLVCEMRTPGIGGLELQEHLRAAGSRIPVIIVTRFGDVSSAVRAMKAGAFDFVEKPVRDEVLHELIRRAIARDAAARASLGDQVKIGERVTRLTRREREIMTLVVEGHSSKEIAGLLGVSFKTVEAHRAKVMRKMQAKSVPHLIRMSLLRPGEGPISSGPRAHGF